ncbi:MAG: acylphosphatase [Candidatus Binatia bacterium]
MTGAQGDPSGVRLIIRGVVQGVGFRYAAVAEARRLGLAGWVRNQPDGSVEVVAAGTAEMVRSLVQWCHRGPPSARVQSVDELALAPPLPSGEYGIRR